jgi:glycosyltransferase involved in cell wall biosynthesis
LVEVAVIELDVLIPYYGDPEYLMAAVESVRAMAEVDFRMVIVEDAYPDGKAVEKRVLDLGDDRITYLRNEKNLGTTRNVHRCLEFAERDLILMMGADDIVLPNYGQALARLLDSYPDAALLQPGVQVVDEQGTPYRPLPDRVKELMAPKAEVVELHGEAGVASLLRGNWLYTPAVTYRRKSIIDIPKRFDVDAVHDLALIVDVLMRGGRLVVSREVAFQYRRHRAGHSSSHARTGKRFIQEKNYFTAVEKELAELGWPAAARAARHRLLSRFNALTQLPGALRSGEREVAGRLLAHALRK